MADVMENNQIFCCPVCHESSDPMTTAHTLPCGHVFHPRCIISWFRRGENSCPVCRDTGSSVSSSSEDDSDEEVMSIDSSDTTTTEEDLEHFRLYSSRAQVANLVRASLSSVRRGGHRRSRSMQRMRVRATRFLKATEEANTARIRANTFLRAHSGPLLQGVKRYNALVRMWGTRERRLRDAALDLYLEHTIVVEGGGGGEHLL